MGGGVRGLPGFGFGDMSAGLGAASEKEAGMRRWDGLVESYLQECEARGLAASTSEQRARELTRFGGWLKRLRPRVPLEEVDAGIIVRYVTARGTFRSRSTVAGVVSQVRSMGEFLTREGIWRTNSLRWMRGPKMDPRMRMPRRISQGDLRAIWNTAGECRSEFARYQTVCLLAVLYATGLRRGELVRLDIEDWDRDSGLLTIDGHKTGRQRKVPVGQGAWRCIEAYLPHRHNVLERSVTVGERALLVGRSGRRLTGHAVSSTIKRLAQSAGVARVTLHQFRHSCASDLLENGASISEVQTLLGHAALESTMRYTHIADPQRSAAIAKHPINEMLGGARGARP